MRSPEKTHGARTTQDVRNLRTGHPDTPHTRHSDRSEAERRNLPLPPPAQPPNQQQSFTVGSSTCRTRGGPATATGTTLKPTTRQCRCLIWPYLPCEITPSAILTVCHCRSSDLSRACYGHPARGCVEPWSGVLLPRHRSSRRRLPDCTRLLRNRQSRVQRLARSDLERTSRCISSPRNLLVASPSPINCSTLVSPVNPTDIVRICVP